MPLDVFLLLLPVVIVSLSLHELAHAYVAWRLGDPTAKEEGRLTLNPIAHLDPLGTLMFALTALLAGVPFGWAKPVPVDPRNFRRPKEGMALVAVAGPVTNFLLALVALAVLRHVAGLDGRAFNVVALAYLVNVILGLFNLIPVPPLDGSRVVGVLMDNATYARWISLDAVGIVIVAGVFVLIQDEFNDVAESALDQVTRVMDVHVLTGA